MRNIESIARSVNTKDDFVKFIGALIQDFKNNPTEWENKTLENYLEAMQSWTEDMEGYYKFNKIDLPNSIPWKIFTDILMAAKMYE